MKSFLNNQRGYVGAMLVIAIAVVVGIMITGITHKMGDLTKSYDKSRAFFDSEIAIEKFSVSLRNAYDRANYLTDLQPQTLGDPVKKDFGCPGYLAMIGTGSSAIRLCWEFSTLCIKRSSVSSLDICLDQTNLQVNVKTPNEWEVAIVSNENPQIDKWVVFKEATKEFVKSWSANQAQANLNAFMPGLPAVTSNNRIELNLAATARSRPEAPDCTASPQFQCLKISFCVKNGGTCAPAELIRQTYLFSRPATTTLGF